MDDCVEKFLYIDSEICRFEPLSIKPCLSRIHSHGYNQQNRKSKAVLSYLRYALLFPIFFFSSNVGDLYKNLPLWNAHIVLNLYRRLFALYGPDLRIRIPSKSANVGSFSLFLRIFPIISPKTNYSLFFPLSLTFYFH